MKNKPIQTFFLEHLNTPTGRVLIVTDSEDRLRAVDWEDHESRLQRLLQRHYGPSGYRLQKADGPSMARDAIAAYFEGDIEAINFVSTLTQGTEFQRSVWDALRRIPAGKTLSYGGLAQKIGRSAACRAVGLANGSNPIPIVVPCHRVIGADASLTGFGGGLERKKWLLAHEQRHAEKSEIAFSLSANLA